MTLHPEETAASRLPTGLRYMVLAAFFFSLMALLVKVVGQRLPSAEMVLARSAVAVVLSYGMLRRARVAPWGRRKGLLVFRGMAGFGGLLCMFYALTKLPLADATVIVYTNPVFTALLAARLICLFVQELINTPVLFFRRLSSMTIGTADFTLCDFFCRRQMSSLGRW